MMTKGKVVKNVDTNTEKNGSTLALSVGNITQTSI